MGRLFSKILPLGRRASFDDLGRVVMRATKYYGLHMFLSAFRSFLHCFQAYLSTFRGFVAGMLDEAKKRKVHTRRKLLMLQMLIAADT